MLMFPGALGALCGPSVGTTGWSPLPRATGWSPPGFIARARDWACAAGRGCGGAPHQIFTSGYKLQASAFLPRWETDLYTPSTGREKRGLKGTS